MKLVGLLLGLCLLAGPALSQRDICQALCDGEEPITGGVVNNSTVNFFHGRRLVLSISEAFDMAYAVLENAHEKDAVWMDRSFDAGKNWAPDGSLLGYKQVEAGQSSAVTKMFNIDDTAILHGIGAIRACTNVWVNSEEQDLMCAEWTRSEFLSRTPIQAAVTALMQYYKEDGLWQTVGWWNGANCLTAMIDYFRLSGDHYYLRLVEESYWKNLDGWWGNFTSDALDDIAWWALAWVDAYDLTGNRTYLDMAALDADFIVAYRDDKCGDGIWWNIYKNYKNAITNELYIKLAAQLHNRIPGDTKYLAEATELWKWFVEDSKMVNDQYLINDGLTDTCENNRDTTWTYNQGVILGAAVELAEAHQDTKYLDTARLIADAVTKGQEMSPNGILREPCELWEASCNWDQASFKGIFLRNLAALNRALPGKPYQDYLEAQVKSNYEHNRNRMNQYGLRIAGPFDYPDANRQHCAVDAFNAALP